jgi:hypothetical protein
MNELPTTLLESQRIGESIKAPHKRPDGMLEGGLDGKAVIITGAAGGFGRVLVRSPLAGVTFVARWQTTNDLGMYPWPCP